MQEKKFHSKLSMSFHTDDGTTQRDMLNKRPLTSSAFSSETRDVACTVCSGSSPLDRALMTLGRDSTLRRKYLYERWQGAIENHPSSDKPHQHARPADDWRLLRSGFAE